MSATTETRDETIVRILFDTMRLDSAVRQLSMAVACTLNAMEGTVATPEAKEQLYSAALYLESAEKRLRETL
jgi:hypothetical protein